MASDASASWSGFNYQGKVAIYYVLKLINDKLGENQEFDFSNYTITLEHHEDFEIKLLDEYKSFHQVKAYASTSYSKYEDALIELSLELSNYPNVIGYIHTWKSIATSEQFLQSRAIASIETIIKEYDGALNKSQTIIGMALSGKTDLPKKASIIKRAFQQSGLDPSMIKQLLRDIISRNGSVHRIKPYVYPTGRGSCELNDLSDLIKGELQSYYQKKGKSFSQNQLERAYYYFLYKLDEHIITRHYQLNNTHPLSISFTEMINSAEMDFEDISNEYLAGEFKETFLALVQNFCNDPFLCEDNSICEHSNCGLQAIINVLSRFSAPRIFEYYKRFSPHLALCNERNIVNSIHIDRNGLLLALFPMFYVFDHEKHIHLDDKECICYRSELSSKELYLPTTINVGTQASIVRSIIQNPIMIAHLYEIDFMITSDNAPDIVSIENAYNKFRDNISLEEYSATLEENKKNKLMKIKDNLRFIKKKEAEAIINASTNP